MDNEETAPQSSEGYAEGIPAENEQAPQGELLAGKFNSPEALAEAYKNLESKLGEQGSELGKLRQENETYKELVRGINPQSNVEPISESQLSPTPVPYGYQPPQAGIPDPVSEIANKYELDEAFLRDMTGVVQKPVEEIRSQMLGQVLNVKLDMYKQGFLMMHQGISPEKLKQVEDFIRSPEGVVLTYNPQNNDFKGNPYEMADRFLSAMEIAKQMENKASVAKQEVAQQNAMQSQQGQTIATHTPSQSSGQSDKQKILDRIYGYTSGGEFGGIPT